MLSASPNDFRRTYFQLSMLFIVSIGCMTRSSIGDDSGDVYFEKNVRPLLVAKCLECHGDEEPEAGLRLTSREAILKGGDSGPAVKLEALDKSLLEKAVRRQGAIKMPPDTPLTEAETTTIRTWIAQGLPWPKAHSAPIARKEFSISKEDRQHWSFRPVSDPAVPSVQATAWPLSSIDRFILAKLEAAKVRPAPVADRRTLLRRATFDLTGMPPTWDDVQAFVNDPASTEEAFRKVVDRLLASPRYGERWGRHWLDVARFADSKDGVLMYGDDRIRPYAYTYRDYVIRAFDEDTPFDQFVREQIAADRIRPMVPSWRLAALGFLTLGRMYDNNVHDIIDDQIDTVSRGLLGLTIACARCHDHKYDPVSTADYYGLYGVFASSEAPLELPMTVDEVPAKSREFEKQAAAKREEIRKFRDDQFAMLSETARQRTDDYLAHVATSKPDPLETAIFFLSLAPDELRPPITARWRKLIERRATSDDPVFGPWHDLMQITEPEKKAEDTTPGTGGETFATTAATIMTIWRTVPPGTKPGQINPKILAALSSKPLESRADVARAYGMAIEEAYALTKSAANTEAGWNPATGENQAIAQLADLLTGPDSPAAFSRSQTRRYMSRAETDKFGGMVQELDRLAVKSPDAPPRAMALIDAEKPYDPHIFVRGNPSAPGKRVERQFPEVLSASGQKPFGNGSGRLELAESIASPENPLTARVIVNRVWMHHFGEPLVASPSDFGKRVSEPAHAQLLDHLATTFVRDGWSLKKLHRRIMNSRAYMLASAEQAPESVTADPDNRLLGRANRQRLSFEAMRDTLLAVSGRIEFRTGGRPADVTDPQSRCRTVFGMVDRQSLPGVFRAFDFASPDLSVERRVRTMGPQQALFALNSPFVMEQAKALAARPEVTGQEGPVRKTTALYRIVLQRDPTIEEVATALDFVSAPSEPGSKLSAWEQFAQVLLSTNEMMYVD